MKKTSLSKTIIYCGDCGKELYRVAHILSDKPSRCTYCKSTRKFYVTHGPVKEQGSTHTANILRRGHEPNDENRQTIE